MRTDLKYRTIAECLAVDSETWSTHVGALRARASERMREALARGDLKSVEHWRLFVEAVQLDPRGWDGYGLLDRWGEAYEGNSGDCSSGCTNYRPLEGELGANWGVEHQGCPAFEPRPLQSAQPARLLARQGRDSFGT